MAASRPVQAGFFILKPDPMKSLLLSRREWDLCLDAAGNIAVCQPPWAVAQNVATAIKTFRKDCWYDQQKGLPYLEQIFGKYPPQSRLRWLIWQCALTQTGVLAASVKRLNLTGRRLTGQVMVTDQQANTQLVNF
jgi:hypothetical protein